MWTSAKFNLQDIHSGLGLGVHRLDVINSFAYVLSITGGIPWLFGSLVQIGLGDFNKPPFVECTMKALFLALVSWCMFTAYTVTGVIKAVLE